MQIAEFAKQMDSKYTTDFKAGKIKKGTVKEIEKLMMQSTFASGNEKENINKKLETYGVYVFVLCYTFFFIYYGSI